ncbi:hypothetical protein K469DRAFT_656055 [Zopfia rhizophila CBS 207.26]|uniref:Uncharacterized protein n=1 Tax=Zopfia rhizophila CBS 207.26 TaxID=1314779 RepID=A0A6A6EMY9_9PEZI|nr:hypothetical protein K469DRAFT_656055 [Zopfia rhizophila CBS 207.26]
MYHQTAMCWASKEGHGDVVEELLLAGGDISYVDSKGQTLLHLAVRSVFIWDWVIAHLRKGMHGQRSALEE